MKLFMPVFLQSWFWRLFQPQFLQSISGHCTWTSSSRPPLKASWPWPLLPCTSTIAFAVRGWDWLGMILAFCVSSSKIILQGFCPPNACDHAQKPMSKSWNQSITRLVQLVLNTFSCSAQFQSMSYEMNIIYTSSTAQGGGGSFKIGNL